MWTTLREQGWARAAATAARQRAGWVATAAREVLEDARAALEEDEGDERREGEDRGDWNLSVDVPSGVGAGSREAAPEKEPAAGWDVSLTPGELEGGRDVSAEVEESDSVKVEEPPQAPTAPSVENPGPDDEVPDVEERREENVPQTEAVEASSEGGEPTAVANTAVAADAPAECSEEERISVSEATTEAQEKRLLPDDGDAPSDEPPPNLFRTNRCTAPRPRPCLYQTSCREAAVEAMQESYEQTLSEAQMARDQAVARLASFDETELQQTRQKLQRAEARIQTLQDAERNLQAALEGMQWSLEAERRADVERAEQRIAELEARWRECEAERDEARRSATRLRHRAAGGSGSASGTGGGARPAGATARGAGRVPGALRGAGARCQAMAGGARSLEDDVATSQIP
eukprot:ctg_1139.g386